MLKVTLREALYAAGMLNGASGPGPPAAPGLSEIVGFSRRQI
jgi:hypothetical protein